MSLETLKSISDWATIVLIALTVVSGSAALIFGNRINERQSTHIGALENEAASLLKQLVEQGPRSHLLYGQRRDRLIERLKPFSGQKVEIRYCAVSFNQYFTDNDTMGVAMLLNDIMGKAGWSVNPFVRENCGGSGLEISVNPKAPESVHQAANALLLGLLQVPLDVVGRTVFAKESPRTPQPRIFESNGSEISLAPLGHDTLVLTVLAHP